MLGLNGVLSLMIKIQRYAISKLTFAFIVYLCSIFFPVTFRNIQICLVQATHTSLPQCTSSVKLASVRIDMFHSL